MDISHSSAFPILMRNSIWKLVQKVMATFLKSQRDYFGRLSSMTKDYHKNIIHISFKKIERRIGEKWPGKFHSGVGNLISQVCFKVYLLFKNYFTYWLFITTDLITEKGYLRSFFARWWFPKRAECGQQNFTFSNKNEVYDIFSAECFQNSDIVQGFWQTSMYVDITLLCTCFQCKSNVGFSGNFCCKNISLKVSTAISKQIWTQLAPVLLFHSGNVLVKLLTMFVIDWSKICWENIHVWLQKLDF